LIVVNPYKYFPLLYNAETLAKYRNRPIGTLPPHVFAIADRAYRSMICGESVTVKELQMLLSVILLVTTICLTFFKCFDDFQIVQVRVLLFLAKAVLEKPKHRSTSCPISQPLAVWKEGWENWRDEFSKRIHCWKRLEMQRLFETTILHDSENSQKFVFLD
jgi:hypothetical protein